MSEIRSQATPARDELERSAIGWQQYISRALGCKPGQLTYQLEECIEKIEALKPRTVNSATELDALPVNSVVVDASDTPRTKRYGDSHMGAGWTNAGRSPLSSRELADGRPMRVLFTPGDMG